MKGLKHITATAGTTVVERTAAAPASAAPGTVERAATAAPASAPAAASEPSLPADPTTAASPTTGGMVAQPSAEENNQEGDTGKGRTAQAPDVDSAPGEKETATWEQEQEVVTMNEPAPAHDVNKKPKAGGELLLELIRSFRGGMLRVDSNLRAAMFRSLRYLVRSKRVFPCIIARDDALFVQPRQNYHLIARKR